MKTLREKEKMLVTSIFSFSLNVLYPTKERNNHLSAFNLSSANAFNLVQSKILLFGKEISSPLVLAPYHTTKSFNHPEKEAFRKHVGKGEKCW